MNARLFLALLFVLSLFAFASSALPAQAADLNISLGPGETARIPLRLWCLDYGLPFPKALGSIGARAPDEVVAVFLAAQAKGILYTDLYQSEVAIWRVPTGKFNDYANIGVKVAQEVYSDSLKIKVPAIPAGVLTIDKAIAEGKVTYKIEDFETLKDPAHPNLPGFPFAGAATLVLTNDLKERVNLFFPEGTVFYPAAGENAQKLLSHQDTNKPAQLPTTGIGSPLSGWLLLLAVAASILMAGARILREEWT